jgi:hypothetical protein
VVFTAANAGLQVPASNDSHQGSFAIMEGEEQKKVNIYDGKVNVAAIILEGVVRFQDNPFAIFVKLQNPCRSVTSLRSTSLFKLSSTVISARQTALQVLKMADKFTRTGQPWSLF